LAAYLNAPVPSKSFDSFDDIACTLLKQNTAHERRGNEWEINVQEAIHLLNANRYRLRRLDPIELNTSDSNCFSLLSRPLDWLIEIFDTFLGNLQYAPDYTFFIMLAQTLRKRLIAQRIW